MAQSSSCCMFLMLLLCLNQLSTSYHHPDIREDCDRYVPTNYDKVKSPDGMTQVDFEYQIENFDTVDVETFVSINYQD